LEEEQSKLSHQLEDPLLYESEPGKVMELNRIVVSNNEKLEKLNKQWARATDEYEKKSDNG
jgi:hypothetical protein